MIEKVFLEAVVASRGNTNALVALALIELSINEDISSDSRSRLYRLVDKWAMTLTTAAPTLVERLKVGLKEAIRRGYAERRYT